MKLAIIGSRTFNKYNFLEKTLDKLFSQSKIDLIISGAAKGADSLGREYANNRGIPLKELPAEWRKYGRGAGFKRNDDIIQGCDVVVCFWDGVSRGSEQALSLARKYKKHTIIIYF